MLLASALFPLSLATPALADVVGSPVPCNENGDGTCTCGTDLGQASCCEQDGFKDEGCKAIQDGSDNVIGYTCTCGVPAFKDTYHPAYRVLTIISAKPGNKSQIGFTAGTLWGTKTQIVMNSSVTDVYQASTNAFSVQGTFSIGSTNGLATEVTSTGGQGFLEPNTADTFSHLNDHFIIWLNPQMDVWSTSGTIGPFTTQFNVDDNTQSMALIDVTLAQLINPSLLPSYVQYADIFANLTLEDRNAIIALDPWGAFYQEPANYPCGGNLVCEAQKGQLSCAPGERCVVPLPPGAQHPVFAATLTPMSAEDDVSTYRAVDLMPPAITLGGRAITDTPPVLIGGGAGTGEPPKMYLSQLDPNRFEAKGEVQVLGPEYGSENGSSCRVIPYSETTKSAASQGYTKAASLQMLAGGEIDWGVKLKVMAGQKWSYSYTDTTIDESGASVQESYGMCSTTSYFHQCLRKYFDKALGTYWFDADSAPSTDPNDQLSCGQ